MTLRLRSGQALVFASASASRRAMLDAAGVSHEAVPAEVDERAIEAAMADAPPGAIALALAQAKALDVSRPMPGRLVLGGDSVVAVDGRRFSKPKSRDDAAAHLRAFSGRTMQLSSAAALARDGALVESHAEQARLFVRDLSDVFIESYLEVEWPAIASCVGCFRIEGPGVRLFTHVEGDHFTILGMPLFWTLGALRRAGALPA
jgi:septum formation protein